jgi:hypothetical protein
MPTVIDALVVQLELDTTDYKRSWRDVDSIDAEGTAKRDRVNKKNDKEERERARVEKQNALDRKKRTDDITGSVATLGRTLAATFLGFESAAGLTKFFAGLTTNEASLGRTATKLGIGADALNIYGKAVEYAGGKTEDVISTFAKLAQEKTFKDLRGEIGPLLQLLQQKGVNYEDRNGKLRDMGAILDDLSKKTRNMSNAERAAMFSQAGIADGVINRMLEEQALQDSQLAKAREFNRINNQNVKDSEDMVEKWREMTDAIGKAGTAARDTLKPAINDTLDAVTKLASGDVMGANQSAGNAILDVGKLYEDYAIKIYKGQANLVSQAIDYWFGGSSNGGGGGSARGTIDRSRIADDLVAPKAGSLAARNNNPGNLEDRNGKFRVFATLAEGQAAMRADLEAKMGKGFETINSIITRYEGTDGKKDPYALAAYITRASALTGKGANEKLTAADIPALMNAMTVVESGLPNSAMRGPQSGATPGLVNRAGSSAPAAGASNTTTVTVGKIEVNSPNADGAQVANATGDALQRKISVAQANAGQQ